MPGSEEVSTMDLKETELTLGLPGGDVFRPDSGEKAGVKRGFVHTLGFNFDNDQHVDHHLEISATAPKPPPSKAQLVGWPPVRASRKNAMKEMSSNCKYVKVAVDGAPYLRKVDLELYTSYQQLLQALEDMFSCSTIRNFFNDGKLMHPVNGSEYVPTYEDKDGDWMMVGDTPWDMFVESCKRIRLMKGSEAIGLEARTPAKEYPLLPQHGVSLWTGYALQISGTKET